MNVHLFYYSIITVAFSSNRANKTWKIILVTVAQTCKFFILSVKHSDLLFFSRHFLPLFTPNSLIPDSKIFFVFLFFFTNRFQDTQNINMHWRLIQFYVYHVFSPHRHRVTFTVNCEYHSQKNDHPNENLNRCGFVWWKTLSPTLHVIKSYSGNENVNLAACIVTCDANSSNEEKVKKRRRIQSFPNEE